MADYRNRGGVEGYINLEIYVSSFAAKLSQNVAASIKNRARSKVIVGKGYEGAGQLRNSIKHIGLDRYTFIVVAETPYAAMQEWGKPNTPFWNKRRYSFTPYMTPAAEEVTEIGVFEKLMSEAWEGAIKSSVKLR